jgi:hypothetical protein
VYDIFPKQNMTILLGDFSAKVGKEGIIKPTIGHENLREIINGGGAYQDGKTPPPKKKRLTILTDRRGPSNVLDV